MITMNNEVIALTALILSSINLIAVIAALSLWIGQKLSTHRIEWRSIKMEDAEDANTLAKKLNEPYDEQEFDLI